MPKKEDYWRNPEKYRKQSRAYSLANPEWHRESNRLWAQKKRDEMSPSERQQKHLRQKKANPQYYLWNHARQRAAAAGIPFDLTVEDIVIPEVCPVFGVKLEWGVGVRGWRNLWAPSLDKIKPELGYVRGNVMIISNRANHLKSNGSIAEFEAVLAYMRRVGAHETPPPIVNVVPTEKSLPLFERVGW